jgi:hypothetical protein
MADEESLPRPSILGSIGIPQYVRDDSERTLFTIPVHALRFLLREKASSGMLCTPELLW